MIVKLGNWSKNPVISRICCRLMELPGSAKKTTPQRCHIKLGDTLLSSLGLEGGKPVVEFCPRKEDYAEAHGSSFIRPHPMKNMALDGWLQAHPENDEEADRVSGWIVAAVGQKKKKD